MRRQLLILFIIVGFCVNTYAQEDFPTLDKLNYDAYLKGDYKAFKTTCNKLLSKNIDYYYLRLRMGISDFNKGKYSDATKNFTKALNFYELDTISREYIFYSYFYSGRYNDAYSYLSTIPDNRLNRQLKSITRPNLKYIYTSLTYSSNNDKEADTGIPAGHYYESVSNTLSFDIGFETYLGNNWTNIFAYKNFGKDGKVYSDAYPIGTSPEFKQNQLYGAFTRLFYPGWEITLFGHGASYTGIVTDRLTNGNKVVRDNKFDFTGGINLAKKLWYLKGELGISASNLSFSNQLRGEGSLTVYPMANLNLYFTSSMMYQIDNKWGNTYIINEDIGFKVFKYLWLESGVSRGNSFLFSKNRGYLLNNSYNVGKESLYLNLVCFIGKQVNLSFTTFLTNYDSYYWNFEDFSRTNKQSFNAFGAQISLTIKPK